MACSCRFLKDGSRIGNPRCTEKCSILPRTSQSAGLFIWWIARCLEWGLSLFFPLFGFFQISISQVQIRFSRGSIGGLVIGSWTCLWSPRRGWLWEQSHPGARHTSCDTCSFLSWFALFVPVSIHELVTSRTAMGGVLNCNFIQGLFYCCDPKWSFASSGPSVVSKIW